MPTNIGFAGAQLNKRARERYRPAEMLPLEKRRAASTKVLKALVLD
jgi:hypothetical protein